MFVRVSFPSYCPHLAYATWGDGQTAISAICVLTWSSCFLSWLIAVRAEALSGADICLGFADLGTGGYSSHDIGPQPQDYLQNNLRASQPVF
jgi:hypothetical protein